MPLRVLLFAMHLDVRAGTTLSRRGHSNTRCADVQKGCAYTGPEQRASWSFRAAAFGWQLAKQTLIVRARSPGPPAPFRGRGVVQWTTIGWELPGFDDDACARGRAGSVLRMRCALLLRCAPCHAREGCSEKAWRMHAEQGEGEGKGDGEGEGEREGRRVVARDTRVVAGSGGSSESSVTDGARWLRAWGRSSDASSMLLSLQGRHTDAVGSMVTLCVRAHLASSMWTACASLRQAHRHLGRKLLRKVGGEENGGTLEERATRS
ncbi:hypothetical protein BKA93DRAFT_747686 [Sparassis latifolia]